MPNDWKQGLRSLAPVQTLMPIFGWAAPHAEDDDLPPESDLPPDSDGAHRLQARQASTDMAFEPL